MGSNRLKQDDPPNVPSAMDLGKYPRLDMTVRFHMHRPGLSSQALSHMTDNFLDGRSAWFAGLPNG